MTAELMERLDQIRFSGGDLSLADIVRTLTDGLPDETARTQLGLFGIMTVAEHLVDAEQALARIRNITEEDRMATHDVPGHNPLANDQLSMGCWAEHEDGSMIYVYSVENGRVIYSLFDRSKDPIVEYRDAMSEADFKRHFSKGGRYTDPDNPWTWHDKTPMPWDLIIKAGATAGPRYASAADQLSAAERVAESLRLRAEKVDADALRGLFSERTLARVGGLVRRFGEMLERLDRDDDRRAP